MKDTAYIITVALVLLSPLCAQNSESLDGIIQERESILQSIVEALRVQSDAVPSDLIPSELQKAEIALYSFRRDTTKVSSDKKKWQTKIIGIHEDICHQLKNRLETGGSTPIDVLMATDDLLAARQALYEIEE